MKLVTFKKNNSLFLGIRMDIGILDVYEASKYYSIKDVPSSVNETILGNVQAKEKLQKLIDIVKDSGSSMFILHEEDIQYAPCVPEPGKIVGVGLNYRKHVEESKMPFPENPVLFSKFSNAIASHQQTIILPHNSNKVDYEAELVIVIGKQAKRVTLENARDHVFGYCIVNELTARDLQFQSSQWLLGKSCDGFSPIGPYLVTSDDIDNPNQLQIKTYLNGELRQCSNTSDMIFSIEEIVSFVSDHMTLEAGDIILTGTPEGVILGYPEEKQIWISDGDRVEVQIEKLGCLVNDFVQGS